MVTNIFNSTPESNLQSVQLPRFTFVERKDAVVKKLQDLFENIIGLSVKTFNLHNPETGHKESIYMIECPSTLENRQIITTVNLKEFNKQHNCNAFIHFSSLDLGFLYDLPTNSLKKIYNDIFIHSELDSSFKRENISFIDLTSLPFVSIDSGIVRIDDQPIYGDLDDLLFVQKTNFGFKVYVAFADITPYVDLNLSDPIVRNANRFGYSVYGSTNHIPMLGKAVEEKCSLLEGQDRFAWIIEYEVSHHGKIDKEKVKIYRGLVNNKHQASFETEPEELPKIELQDNLREIRQCAKLLDHTSPIASLPFKIINQHQQTTNSAAIGTFMTVTRHLIGSKVSERTDLGIYRIQTADPDDGSFNLWSKILAKEGMIYPLRKLKDPKQLIGIIIELCHSENDILKNLGVTILDYLSGKACYSTDPGLHKSLNYEPYMDIKGLRKLTGLVNQFILMHLFENDGTPPPSKQLILKLNTRANHHKRNIEKWCGMLAATQTRIANN